MAAYALPGIFVMGCLVYFMEPYVIRCPEQSEWNIRAEIRCQNIAKYFCLYNYIHYTYEEGCTGPEWDIVGSKRVYSRDFNNAPCNDTRYQPIRFVTNGSSDCIFRKSLCTEEGQTLLANGSTKTDSTCRCDYKQGYAFVTVPRNKCSCRPSEEDCSCYVKKCQGIGYNLSADYECTKDVTKKNVCLLMSENLSEDPHIDMAPTGTPREYDSYAIKRTCDVAILVSIFFLVIIVITICALCHQRLPRCPCLSTNQCSSPSGTPEKKKLVDPDQLKLIKEDEGNKILWNEANEFTKEGVQEPEKKPEPMKTPAPPKVPQAVEELNGKTLFADRAQKKAEGQTELKDKSKKINRVNLFVKNLNHNIDDDRLRKEFSQFGTITSAKVETKDGRSKGFGYVCFSSPEEATKAITGMDGITVDGKALYVALHQRKEARKAHLASQYSQVDGLVTKEEEQVYSPEFIETLSSYDETVGLADLEEKLISSFANGDSWREGRKKTSFNYLLLDPRVTKNLPSRMDSLGKVESFKVFVAAIFYVGKGQRARPFNHLYEAISQMEKTKTQVSEKVKHIQDIWSDNVGVVSLQCFQNVIPVEAYTRESCMIDALSSVGVDKLTHRMRGKYYGISETWSKNEKRNMGFYFLKKALQIFKEEGERAILPVDLKGGQ